MNKDEFNSYYFHDGQLLSYHEKYNISEDCPFAIVVEMALYKNHESVDREKYVFTFEYIKRATKVHHFHNHEPHFRAGNISNGFKNGKNTYMIYLCSGLIEIEAKKVTVKNRIAVN